MCWGAASPSYTSEGHTVPLQSEKIRGLEKLPSGMSCPALDWVKCEWVNNVVHAQEGVKKSTVVYTRSLRKITSIDFDEAMDKIKIQLNFWIHEIMANWKCQHCHEAEREDTEGVVLSSRTSSLDWYGWLPHFKDCAAWKKFHLQTRPVLQRRL
jgi:hypothetical protein